MFLRNWARLYSHQTAAEMRFEASICLLGKPYRAQHPFFGLRRIVDFVLPEERIAIEVDGSSHDQLAQRYKDISSTIQLENAGWKVIRFTNAEVLRGLDLSHEILQRVTHRPSIQELETQLRGLPTPVSKPRGRKRAPGPKKARASKARRGSKSADTK